MQSLSLADRAIVDKLVARRDSGRDQRLNFLANRFNKDVAKFVENVIYLSSKRNNKNKKRQESYGRVDKEMMREILTHLKVF